MNEKVGKAILRIKEARKIAGQMGNDLVLAYSGGKDSDVLLDLAVKSGIPFVVQHNHTTADAPETVYHIRTVFAEMNARGITASINWPLNIHTVDGRVARASMWNLIPKKQMPPTRTARYCCRYFKERNFDGQHLLMGVRWAESPKRKTRGLHEELSADAETRVVYCDENDDRHKLMDFCHLRSRVATNPIIDWTDADVWCYIKEYRLKINPLYAFGFRRVGCVGCPLAGGKGQQFGFQLYPKYRAAYIKAFDRMLEYRDGNGHTRTRQWADGATTLEWWTQNLPPDYAEEMKQISFFDNEMGDDF